VVIHGGAGALRSFLLVLALLAAIALQAPDTWLAYGPSLRGMKRPGGVPSQRWQSARVDFAGVGDGTLDRLPADMAGTVTKCR